MKRRVLIPLALALMLIVALAPAALAAPLDDTIIEANETVNNDVIVLDGDLTIHEGAVVNGDVVVFNGDANVFGLPYRIFVCILGLVITMLSLTGVYIWWKKRVARAKQSARLTAQAS